MDSIQASLDLKWVGGVQATLLFQWVCSEVELHQMQEFNKALFLFRDKETC